MRLVLDKSPYLHDYKFVVEAAEHYNLPGSIYRIKIPPPTPSNPAINPEIVAATASIETKFNNS